ncbi:D site-binding protein [Exaiptasia diaphana]|nr:D site-binding protein [Exaiptasia diaphana]
MSLCKPSNKDYMDIDEFLSSRDLCGDLATLTEADVDFTNLTDPVDFSLSAEQLHEYTANQLDIEEQVESVASPVSSDEGRGKSISSDTGSSFSFSERSIDGEFPQTRSRKSCDKSVTSESEDSSKARTSTWKVSSCPEKQCLATSVEIEGVAYTYNLIPTSKSRKPRRRSVPGSMKDEKYWDRRSKNNEAAKRSRDLRRKKEMLVASKAADLEMENEELRAEVQFLKERVKMQSGSPDKMN